MHVSLSTFGMPYNQDAPKKFKELYKYIQFEIFSDILFSFYDF